MIKKSKWNVPASVRELEIMAPPGMEEMISQLQSSFECSSGKTKNQIRVKVNDA